MSKRTTNLTPPRPPRGSIRKAKRAEMRKQKMVNLAIAQAAAQTERQIDTQTVLQIGTKVKEAVESPEKPKGRVIRRLVRSSIQLVSRKALTAKEPHELSVELSGGQTISQGIMGIV